MSTATALSELREEHLQIAVTLQILRDDLDAGMCRQRLAADLDFLTALCRRHIEREQVFFQAIDHVLARRHRAMHRLLLRYLGLLASRWAVCDEVVPRVERICALVSQLLRQEDHLLSDITLRPKDTPPTT